jgi:hypothetical protein
MPTVEVRYDAPATVGAFMESNAFVRAIVGPVGSGKSSGCIMEILRRSAEQAKGPDGVRRTRWVIIRNTYGELRDTTRKTFEQWVPSQLGRWHEQSFTFTMEFEDIHSEVLFRALDRPEDVKKLLSLEITGAYINEAREVPKDVVDVLQTRVGRYPAKRDGGATWFGVWMDTNPWHVGHEFYELFKSKPEGFELFEQPGGREPNAENVENLPDGYYRRMCAGKDSEWIAEYVDGKYPSADKGSIYGALLARLEADGRICDFAHPSDGVFASFDLGVSDSTAIWWWRVGKHGVPDIIDWYEASGEGASHYFDALRKRGHRLTKIWLPHDARARTFQTGVSTVELFNDEFPGLVTIGPELTIDDGIGAARWLLEQPIRIHSRCAEGLKRLRAYRFRWDEVKKVFSKVPLHDWTSHTADAFRYVACVAKATERLTRPDEPKVSVVIRHTKKQTLDEAIEESEYWQAPSGRI